MKNTKTIVYEAVLIIFFLTIFIIIMGQHSASESVKSDSKYKKTHPLSLKRPYNVPYPQGLKTQVNFWIDVFTKYSTNHTIIHDDRHLDIVFTVIDVFQLPEYYSEGDLGKAKLKAVKKQKKKYETILKSIHNKLVAGKKELSYEEMKVFQLYKRVQGRNKFLAASKRIRAQRGLSNRFREALANSTMYIREIENIFRKEKLPVEISRLPFLESLFDPNAKSKVGALGLWQFTKSTGKKYLTIDEYIDERYDPIKSTIAATKFLRGNYEILGTWPLALTAYNHGRYGMKKAVKATGTTDILHIIKRYKGKYFGFASRNFYAEFLAVLEISNDYKKYYGDIHFERPEPYELIYIKDVISMEALTKSCNVRNSEINRLNPGLTNKVKNSVIDLPVGLELRVPKGVKRSFDRICRHYVA